MRSLPLQVTRGWDRLLNRLQPGVHQHSHVTARDRYPLLFRAARRCADAAGLEQPRILSFGCSSGEECLSLRRVFPDARIVGTDVSPRILARARRACAGDRAIRIVRSRDDAIAALAPFDAVFALSVLCRHKETRTRQDCSRVYPFERFDSAVRRLAGWLAPGGLLVIYNANFRFRDSSVARDFEDVTPAVVRESGSVAKFDRGGRRLGDPRDRGCIFRKRGD